MKRYHSMDEYRISQIVLRNITSYQDEQIELPINYDFIIINGYDDKGNINGSGKSSIIYSILTGLNLLSNYKFLKNINTEDDAEICLKISNVYKHKDIVISKRFNKTKNFFKIESSDENDMIFLRIKDNETFLKELFQINENYMMTHFLTSTNESLFDLSYTQIFVFMEKLFKIDELDKINDISKEEIKKITNQKTQFLQQLEINNQLIKELEQKNNEITYKIDDINKDSDKKQQNLINEIQTLFNSISNKFNSLNLFRFHFFDKISNMLQNKNFNDLIPLIEFVINVLKSIYYDFNTSKDSVLNKIHNKINELKIQETQIKKEINEFNKLKQLQICPVCKQKIDETTKINYQSQTSELIKLLSNIVNKISENDKYYNFLKHDVHQIQDIINLFFELKMKIQSYNDFFNNKSEISDTLSKEYQKNLEKIKQLVQKNDEINKKISELDSNVSIYEFIIQLTKPKSELRQKYFMFGFVDKILEICSKYNSLIFDENESFEIEFDFDKNQIIYGIKRDGSLIPYKFLSNGEKKKVSIVFILTLLEILNYLKIESKLKILVFDDFFSGLDSQNVYKILNMLNYFNEKFRYQIIISNNNIDYIDFPHVRVNILKKNGISFVESIQIESQY